MKQLFLLLLILLSTTMCTKEKGTVVRIETNQGTIRVRLYDETPLHRDNFIKLVNEGFYTDKIFHRVIKGFMIQGGDTATGHFLDYTIPAEFRMPARFHKRGALAAARFGDDTNPEKASSASQFYIVTGEKYSEFGLDALQKERNERLKQNIYNELQSQKRDTMKTLYREGNKAGLAELRAGILAEAEKQAESRKTETLFTDEQREIYMKEGGTPHLDGEYTVFGEVVEGMDVVSKIESSPTSVRNRPLEPVIILRARVDH